jgi:hypothetical protein
MAQTPPVAPDALPTTPTASVPTGFALTMDTFLAALTPFRTQLVALATNCYNNCLDALASAGASAASAATALGFSNSAAASASAAAVSSGVAIWVSGTTYAIGDVRFSPANSGTYRRRTAGAGTTDPSTDTVNWTLISYGSLPVIYVTEEKASGAIGNNSIAGTQTRTLNTVKANTIGGASLASNQVTLPIGTYKYRGSVPSYNTGGNAGFLYNVTTSAYIGIGTSENTGSATGSTRSLLSGIITLTAATVLEVRHFTTNVGPNYGLGYPATSGQVEVYTEILFEKVA